MGATTVPLSYLIVWDFTKSIRASTFAAFFILFGKFLYIQESFRRLRRNWINEIIVCRCRNVNAESIYPSGSDTAMLYDVRYVGHGARSVTPRSIVYSTLVVLVVVHWGLARMHDQCEIRWLVCRSACWSLYRIRTLARIGGFVQTYRK